MWIRRTWRCRGFSLEAALIGLAALVVGSGIAISGGWVAVIYGVGIVLLVGIPGLYVARELLHVGLWIGAEEVVVRNTVRTTRIPVSEVLGFTTTETSYPGIAAELQDGTLLNVWALGRVPFVSTDFDEHFKKMTPECESLNELLADIKAKRA